jgi:DNA-binding LacI/PurR family transcriptional regulator
LRELSSDPEIKGIILQPVHGENHNPQILKLILKKYPLVLIDRYLEGSSLPFVGTDNTQVTKKFMDLIFEMGHTHIGFISSSPERTTAMLQRYGALSDAYSKRGLANVYGNHFFGITSNEDLEKNEKIKSDILGVKEHLQKNPQLTCLVCGEFTVYCLVKAALDQLNKRVPEDISLITFDNVFDAHLRQNVAYVRQNEYEMGRIAVELLSDRISGETTGTKVYIAAEFVWAESIKDLR